MLALANMVDLFANKLSSLRAGRFSFSFVLFCTLQRSFLRHDFPLVDGMQMALPEDCCVA